MLRPTCARFRGAATFRRPQAVPRTQRSSRHRALRMTKRGGRVGVGVAIAVWIAVPAAAQTGQPASSLKAPVITDTARLKGPRQPIFFRHDVHAGQDQVPCLYCHSTVTISSEPGIPALQTCFGCHQMIGGSTPSHQAEIKKVREAWARSEEHTSELQSRELISYAVF